MNGAYCIRFALVDRCGFVMKCNGFDHSGGYAPEIQKIVSHFCVCVVLYSPFSIAVNLYSGMVIYEVSGIYFK